MAHVPKYIPPKQVEAMRATRRAALFWIAVALPLIFALLVFGYSDQAPSALRSVVISLDRAFGYPLAWLLGAIAPGA
jgi:hypothetical protein